MHLADPEPMRLPHMLDSQGRRYTFSVVEGDPFLLIQLHHRQWLVGEAKCLRASPETLLLKDIAIANHVIPKPINSWLKILHKMPGWQPQPINYRGYGLGTALLLHLIHYARDNGFKSLRGELFRADLENNTNLLKWYQKHGFEIIQTSLEDNPDLLGMLHMSFL